MEYTYNVPLKKGTKIKSYIAEIVGPDPKWKFEREFLLRGIIQYKDSRDYHAEIGPHGVYEIGVKYVDINSGDILENEKKYIVYYNHRVYELHRDDVLYTLFNLKMQYKRYNKAA